MKKRAFALFLAAALALTVSAGAAVPAPPPGGGSSTFYLSSSATELESGAYEGTVFADSTRADEVAVRAGDGVTAELRGVSIRKSAGNSSGDDTSFYGINSGLLVYGKSAASAVTLSDSEIATSASGANGVFAYGKGVVTMMDSTVTTTSSASGGIMVAGGGKLYALNLKVTTEGGSSAAIRSDRGSGRMIVDQGIYISNGSIGTGSPAIYCVADITAANSTLVAKNAQAICFEGRNPAWIYNCWLEGRYTASDDDENCNVMVYQSMSGDSDEGTSSFTMVGGVLKANNVSANGNAKMFYTTNTYCYINLADVEMIYSDGMDTFLLCACNTNARGWGKAGQNGSECVLYCVEQDVKGDMIYDTWSLLYCYFTQGTVAETALVCREDNGGRGASVYMDASSVWYVTGDSRVNDLYTGGGKIVDKDGKTVSVVGADGNAYVAGDSPYTVTVTGVYSTEDKSAYDAVPTIGTEKPAFVYDLDALGVDTSVYTPCGEEDYVYATGKSISVQALEDVLSGEGGESDQPEQPDQPGEGGEMPGGPGGDMPDMPEGEGGGNGNGDPAAMVSEYTVNPDGTVTLTLSGLQGMDTYDVNGVACGAGDTVTVTPVDGKVVIAFTGGGGPNLGLVYTIDLNDLPGGEPGEDPGEMPEGPGQPGGEEPPAKPDDGEKPGGEGGEPGEIPEGPGGESGETPEAPEQPGQPDAPLDTPTGDNSRIGLWIGLLAAAVAAIAVLLVLARRRSEDEDTAE